MLGESGESFQEQGATKRSRTNSVDLKRLRQHRHGGAGDRIQDSRRDIFLRLVGQPYCQVGESISVANGGFYVHGIRPAVRLHVEGSAPAQPGLRIARRA